MTPRYTVPLAALLGLLLLVGFAPFDYTWHSRIADAANGRATVSHGRTFGPLWSPPQPEAVQAAMMARSEGGNPEVFEVHTSWPAFCGRLLLLGVAAAGAWMLTTYTRRERS
jgi:hypothetical protein